MRIDRYKLRKLRETKGYSLRELAEISGVNYTSLHRWETLDTALPRPSNISKIANALGVTISDLEINDKEGEKPNEIFTPILYWLDYWINYTENAPICSYHGNEVIHDIYRALNDFDCQQTNGNLFADMIFSVWNPLKMVLECLNPGKHFYKEDKYGRDKNSYLKNIKDNIETYLPKENDLVKKTLQFADMARTRANVMVLPSRSMQARGSKYFDQMPVSLYQCFDNGEYNKFFEEMQVEVWVEKQHLKMFFQDEQIQKDKILPLIKNLEASECKWLREKEDIEEMLQQYIEILEKRSTYYCCP